MSRPKTSAELCRWLRDCSSGIYRPSADAADLIERLERENARLSSTDSDMASIADLLNTWARECGVDEAHGWSGSDIKAVIDRLWTRANQSK